MYLLEFTLNKTLNPKPFTAMERDGLRAETAAYLKDAMAVLLGLNVGLRA